MLPTTAGVWQWGNMDLPAQPDDEMLPTGAVSLGAIARQSGRCDEYLAARGEEAAADEAKGSGGAEESGSGGWERRDHAGGAW